MNQEGPNVLGIDYGSEDATTYTIIKRLNGSNVIIDEIYGMREVLAYLKEVPAKVINKIDSPIFASKDVVEWLLESELADRMSAPRTRHISAHAAATAFMGIS